MKSLLGYNLQELKEVAVQYGLPTYTAKQMAEWLYKKRVSSIDEMTNLSISAREKLSAEYEVGRVGYSNVVVSFDGTKKYLFPMNIETVMIPSEERSTICVSSQIGCRMGCKFCMTGRMGFHGNLSAAEILSQFLEIDESEHLTNAVFMGMGEPLDNYEAVTKAIEILTADWGFGWSPRRITLSTIGVNPYLKRFLEENKCHIAISLHDPFAPERNELMPMEKAFPIAETVELIKQYDFSGQRRVSFEYIMFEGVNDTKRHADALIRMLRGLECRVNLIRFHKIPDSPLAPSIEIKIELFQKRLNDAGVIATVRASRGEDVLAACGMLSGSVIKN